MQDWANKIATGDLRALARAASAIENRESSVEELFADLRKHSNKKPLVLGVTADPGIFIRSMATRGSLGGLADATAGLVRLFGAAGRDVVIVETVGVGQAEVAVAQLATITLVVLAPGMGDDIQASKAGIMEIADIFVINKADHPGVEQTEREIQAMLSLGHGRDGWIPPIVRTVATDGKGIAALMAAVEQAAGGLHKEKRPHGRM